MDNFTRHMVLILADIRRLESYRNQLKSGEITQVEYLTLLSEFKHLECDCDECKPVVPTYSVYIATMK